jgi:hypothetical protein
MENWTSKWEAAKTAFESKVEKKKPSEATINAIKKGHAYAEVEKALKHCAEAAKGAADHKKLEAAVKAFGSKVSACEKSLLAAVEKADHKIVQPEIAALMKHVHALTADMKAHLEKAGNAKG